MGHPQEDRSSEPNVIYLDTRRPKPRVVVENQSPSPRDPLPPLPEQGVPGFPWHRVLWPILAVLVLGTISWAAWAL
ncbi:hypothetical protein [Marinovum sp.]|uniref:hypothetical protein n=1 Tax=Marinovum sp. TaxID=2024839 RepID=UPI002B2686D0|nr:hypothetical protein [Marinovum sp.]